MRIQSIELEGLWAYRDAQRIDISGLNLVVGVGENGAGKSMLLVQAILVAFYGKFPTKTIDESITTGAALGRVSVEFTVGDALYRVGRVYPRVGSATGVVAVADSSQKTGWRTVTEKGVTEVNEYITKLIGMNHETATMTWIAEQGQYGKFSGALPSKRFTLLSTIFGLDEYKSKAKLAGDRAKSAESDVTRIDGRVAEVEAGIEQTIAEIDTAPHAAASDQDLAEARAAADAEVDRIGQAIAELGANDPARHTVETRQALELVRNERVHQLNTALADRARAVAAVEESQIVGRQRRLSAEAAHDQQVTIARKRTADAQTLAESVRAAAVQALADIASARRSLPELVDAVSGYRDDAADARAQAQAASADAAAALSRREVLKSEWAATKVSIADAEARIVTLGRTAADSEHAECFACGQHLSAQDAQALIESQRQDIARIGERQVQIKNEGATAAADAEAAEARRTMAEAAATTADENAAAASTRVTRAEALIATESERQSAADDADIAVNRARNEEQETLASAAATLQSALAIIEEQESDTVAAATQQITVADATIAKHLEPAAKEVSLAAELAAAEAAVADEVAGVESRRRELLTEREQAKAQSAALAQAQSERAANVKTLDEYRARLDTLRAERTEAGKRRDLFQTLHRAYSPAGIPAMVLAGVVDELNESVNASLERLSRGELRVELRTSRETSSGTTENKVTVWVETPTGVRAYESLSGGQKFRVDVAIRIGLAKAVARGSGTPIQTFLLDEGWGSLDEKGIRSTFDTLHRLSEEVAIVTVSHIDAVRDAFPSRVEVSMSGGNSVAEVIR